MSFISYFAALFLLIISGCSTHRALDVALGDDTFQGSAALLSVDLVGKRSCQFSFVNTLSEQKYLLEIKSGKQDYLIELPAGRYVLSRFQCGFSYHEHKSFFGAQTSEFSLESNKVSFLGAVKLNLEKKESLQIEGDYSYRFNELKRLYGKLGLFSKSNLVSAYTLKPINSSSFEDYQEKRSFNIKAVLVKSQRKDLDEGMEEVKKLTGDCFLEEAKKNPLKYGVLNYRLFYRKGAYWKHEEVKNTSSYSTSLKNCLVSNWANIKVSAQEKLSLDIFL